MNSLSRAILSSSFPSMRAPFLAYIIYFCLDFLAAPPKKFEAIAQLRHRHAGVPVEVEVISEDAVKLNFTDEWSVVAPGQAAVLYDLENQEVLAGGRINGGSSRLSII